MSSYHPDDPRPDAPVARIRDAVNAAFDAAVAEHAPGAGVALVGAVSVAVDGGESLDLDTRTTIRADLERLRAIGVDLGVVDESTVVMALLGALAEDAATATATADPGGDPRLN